MMKKLALVLVLMAGCGPDPAMVKQIDEQKAEIDRLNTELQRAERERDALRSRAERLNADMEKSKNEAMVSALGLKEGQKLSAELDTTMGTITCVLWPDKAPKTVVNFVQLAEGSKEWTNPRTGEKTNTPLYNGTIFHRVIPGFMIQGGDPLGNGTGGPGYKFEDETDNGLQFDHPGLLAMANAGPNTNGSQFFITDSTPSHLNGKHTIFGDCTPIETVRAIANVERGSRDKPVKDVVLKKVTITRE